ncbi:MAG: hypothetical protein IJ365_01980, partial [Clostridia bacterium]|nr:hypothetical protein [Clostridia bacterium]
IYFVSGKIVCVKLLCTCHFEIFIKISVRQVAGGLTPVKTDKLKDFKNFRCQAVRVRVLSH